MGYSRADHDFENEDLDRKDQAISRAVARGLITGLESLRLTHAITIERQKIKGRLLISVRQAMDGNSRKSSRGCNKTGHRQPCACGKAKFLNQEVA